MGRVGEKQDWWKNVYMGDTRITREEYVEIVSVLVRDKYSEIIDELSYEVFVGSEGDTEGGGIACGVRKTMQMSKELHDYILKLKLIGMSDESIVSSDGYIQRVKEMMGNGLLNRHMGRMGKPHVDFKYSLSRNIVCHRIYFIVRAYYTVEYAKTVGVLIAEGLQLKGYDT